MLISDFWVLQAVKGFRIPFVSLPNQDILPTAPLFPPEQATLIKGEHRLLLEKVTETPVPDSQEPFIQASSWYPRRMAK